MKTGCADCTKGYPDFCLHMNREKRIFCIFLRKEPDNLGEMSEKSDINAKISYLYTKMDLKFLEIHSIIKTAGATSLRFGGKARKLPV